MKLKSIFNTTTLEFYTPDFSTSLELPFMDVGISAGFPSHADDFIELSIDLNKTLIKNKDTANSRKRRLQTHKSNPRKRVYDMGNSNQFH